ncbi:MAG: glycine zipper family protein [Planctomycetota bacterium]
MRTVHFAAILLLAACASPPRPERAPAVPLGPPTAPVTDLRDGLRSDADRSPRPAPPAEVPASSAATVTWRTVTETIEVPAPAPEPLPANEHADWPRGHVYDDPYWRVRHRSRGYWFPVGTVVGAGVGSVIGRHHGHRGRGAWIGGSVGFIWDLHRLWR